MDIGLAAAMMSRITEGEVRHRYSGSAMLSALPGAPVVAGRHPSAVVALSSRVPRRRRSGS